LSTNCQFTLTRSSFSEPSDGGATVTGGKAVIENNLFSNGGPQPDGDDVTQVLPGSVMRFNTFVNYYTAADRAGTALRCDATLDVTSNIFAWGQNAINGACVARYSLFDDAHTMPTGQNNVLTDLPTIFTSATDFHLSATSAARDHGESNTGVSVDLDGNARPATPDIGAFEAQ
jgi:hypothetical protein